MTLTELDVLASVRAGLDHVGHRLMTELDGPIDQRVILWGRLHWLGGRLQDLIQHEQARRIKKETHEHSHL